VCVADNNELTANFSNSKSGSPCSSLYALNDCPNLPVSCSMNFLGSSSSLASTPASNGSSSNGLSLDVSSAASVDVSSDPVSVAVSSTPASDDEASSTPKSKFSSSVGVSSVEAESADGSAVAGVVFPSFNLYLISSRLFF
jgi:hypothetical protein